MRRRVETNLVEVPDTSAVRSEAVEGIRRADGPARQKATHVNIYAILSRFQQSQCHYVHCIRAAGPVIRRAEGAGVNVCIRGDLVAAAAGDRPGQDSRHKMAAAGADDASVV